MHRLQLFLILLSTLLSIGSTHAGEQPFGAPVLSSPESSSLITWAVPNWPPFFIPAGPLAGQGISDGRQQFIQEKLTDYRHASVDMNFSRFFKQAAKYQNLCMVDLLKQHRREEWVEFSMPIAVTLPPALIISSQHQQQWQIKDQFPLAQLLRQFDKKVIFESDRSYGLLDNIIQNHLHLPQVRKSPINTSRLTNMLLNDRVDYMVEYPFAAFAIAKAMGRSKEIQTVTIAEQPRYLTAHVACTNNLWGQKVIRKINKIIKTHGASHEYRQAANTVMRFLPAKDQLQLNKIYDDVFLPMLLP